MTDPIAELRETVKRLRELAAAAKDLTGDGNGAWFPWSVVRQTEWVQWPEPRPVPVPFAFDGSTELAEGGYEPTGNAFVAHARWVHDREEDWHEAEFIAGPMPEALARFIASMHPAVAEALADLLEAHADQAQESGVWLPHALSPGPLAVARAYLGDAAEN